MASDSETFRGPTGASAADNPFHGGGEAGAILRAIDWSKKPIGPVEHWPQSLRTALSICLASRHPICIIWGPSRLYFYNDAYTPILGAKHPWALGESYSVVWPEIWESVIRPILENVEATGQASWADDLLLVLRRHGYDEECYFAFSFAPTRVEDGSVGGVFTAITETTAQVVGERRLRTLRDLGARAPDAKSAGEACRIAAEVLALNRYDVPFALFYLTEPGGGVARLVEAMGLPGDGKAAPVEVPLRGATGEDPWGFREVIGGGRRVVRALRPAELGSWPAGPWPEPVNAAIVWPIARPGEAVPYGFLVCGASPRRPLDGDYESFFGLVAGQVATAVSNAQVYAEAQQRAEALAQLDRAKTDFFSNVSHEFRTPLTLMLGPLEELMAGSSGLAHDPAAGEQLKVIHRNSLRLLKLVNSLLDFSRIEAGRIEASYEPVDLAAFTTELAAMFRAAVEKAGLRLVVACRPSEEPAYVDRDMWEKIVFNLLSNAYKFTKHGEIVLQLQQTETEFVLSVRDTGSGIAPEAQAEVFKRFHRVPNPFSRTHEGSGIGLALVHELARLHGGRVDLASEPGVGSIFTVRIPRGRAHLPAERMRAPTRPAATVAQRDAFVEESLRWLPATGAEPKGGPAAGTRRASRQRVLVVDDNADMRDYVQRLLQDDYEVRLAEDGSEAFREACAWRPDLVLTDVMMPGLDGFGLVKALRADERTQTVPVIVLSARAGEEARVEGLAAGADDYLTKPFGARELRARVESHLHLAALRREAEAKITATEARFEQLVTMMPAGMIVCAADGRIVYFNRRAAEIWGAAPLVGETYASFAARFKVLEPDGTPAPIGERHMAVALREGRSFDSTEGWMERPDGSRFLANFNIRPTHDRDGRVTGAINVFQDVTREREARLALRESEERYRAVFQQASVGIFECELDGTIVRTNPALGAIVGFTPDELKGRNWRDLVHPEELAADEELVTRLLSGAVDSIRSERRFRRRDGTFGWVDVFGTLTLNAAGAPTHGLAVVVDISERKRAEAELRETEDRFRTAADSAPVLIWMADEEERATWFNRLWREFVGRTLEQDRDHGWLENVHPEEREASRRRFHVAFEARQPFAMEYRLRRHDGEYRWVLDHGVPRHRGAEFIGYIGTCIDITDRKLAERAMHESRNAESARRQELEVITQVAPAGIWMARDHECRIVTGNEAAHRFMRVPAGSNLSLSTAGSEAAKRVTICAGGVPLTREQLPLQQAVLTGQPVLNRELELRFADGSSTWLYGSATPLFDRLGEVRGAICVMVDITERRTTEAALRKSEEQLRLVTDHASAFIAQVDREHRYQFVNRSYAERYGRAPQDFVGVHVAEIAGQEVYQAAAPAFARALAGERVEFEMELPLPNVGRRWVHVVLVPERAGDGAVGGLVAVLVDITARKRAEVEVARARDEAVAASRAKDDFLAALSHELRTPLSPVLLLASEAAADPALPEHVRAEFNTIRKSVELEARLIDDLLDVTRITRHKLALDQRAVDVAVVVRDALATVRADHEAKRIVVEAELGEVPLMVFGDPVRLQQVFWNILKNAVKFTPEAGRVKVRGGVSADGERVVVEVQDTGLGITAQELERVFDAFSQGDHAMAGGSHRFGGLGLGLAISRSVVGLHGGRITAASEGRHHGATIRVELPALRAAESPGPVVNATPARRDSLPPLATAQPEPRSAGRILLVEDHAPTRKALERLLTRRRYEVRCAATAAEARELAARERFDFVVSDIGLPDGSGYDLMAEFRRQRGLSGVALTGYGRDDDIARSEAAGFVLHLTKPVGVQALDKALAELRRRGPVTPA